MDGRKFWMGLICLTASMLLLLGAASSALRATPLHPLKLYSIPGWQPIRQDGLAWQYLTKEKRTIATCVGSRNGDSWEMTYYGTHTDFFTYRHSKKQTDSLAECVGSAEKFIYGGWYI